MAVIKCENNHYYDNDKFKDCPHCAKNSANSSDSKELEKNTVFKYSNTSVNVGVVSNNESDDAGKTDSIFRKKSNPVSGWLVCTQGENKGRSFELHLGKNFVGRSMKSDVVINDPQISRQNHFCVIYDPFSSKFHLQAGSSIVYLNSQMLEKAQELKENDVIGAGESSFVFVPFCKEGRDWDD